MRHIRAVLFMVALMGLITMLSAVTAPAQQREALTPPWLPPQQPPGNALPPTANAEERSGPVARLYRALRSVGLDENNVFHVREAALERGEMHIYLTDGTIAFTRDVEGRVTGAYYEGEGEVLMRPPDLTEHASLGLFSGMGVLDEHFTVAYLRFNRDLEGELRPYLRESEEPEEFVRSHDKLARELAALDGLRLLSCFTEDAALAKQDDFLHGRLATRLGTLNVYYDSLAEDQFEVARLGLAGGTPYLDVWMAFPGMAARKQGESRVVEPASSASAVAVERFRVDTTLTPPEMLEATAELDVKVNNGGQRLLIFELSRWLQVHEISVDGVAAEFLQNEALTGSDLARIGNDLVSVVMPATLRAGERHRLRFQYAGAVMQQAAPGLLYVGARGTWYPNRGSEMSGFELKFRWPAAWTLVATGQLASIEEQDGTKVGQWNSEENIPVAGFNLGKFARAEAQTDDGKIEVASYSAGVVEKSLAKATPELAAEAKARNTAIARRSAETIGKYKQWFGPYPYGSLALTQMPGAVSQGWPTLVYLSSFAYLSDEERQALRMNDFERLLYGGFMEDHEIAHQWWGDRVGWKNYRDQWLMEALANLSALMIMEGQHPAEARELLSQYRAQLLATNGTGRRFADAGPVTLGYRLSSSVFPNAYIPVTYGRGLWLLKMLRDYFADYEKIEKGRREGDRFMAALREFGNRYERRTATTDDFRKVLEAFLPANARFEGERSLKWFFDEWVRGSSVPEIALKQVVVKRRGAATIASFTLLQGHCPESLVTSVPMVAELAGGERVSIGRVFADGYESKFELIVPQGTHRLLADPEKKLLRLD
jgi:hypothetical protein